MIPKIIHYCWFGRKPMPDLALQCIESWHRFMPDYEFKIWDEESFDVNALPYTQEAYKARRYAFVSDVARLKALSVFGGIYFDVDFEVFKPFDDLLGYKAFAGFEGSKYNPVMMGVIASEANGAWVEEQLESYLGRNFIVDGKEDLTTNVQFVTHNMQRNGFIPDGKEQDYKDLHIFPVEYFCPKLTTGEYVRSEHTYCEHMGVESSWAKSSLKGRLIQSIHPSIRIKLIRFKRMILG